MRIKTSSGFGGFTLIELLVAMAVLSMLVMMFIQLTSAVARTTKASNQLIDSAFQSRLAYERIGMDLAGLLKRHDVDFNAANVPVGGSGKMMQFITGVTTSGKSGSFSSLQCDSPEKEGGSGSLRRGLKVWCKTIFKTYIEAKATESKV
jgi:prepilin-type N-terminal cleavage/methylation domain-containing protein